MLQFDIRSVETKAVQVDAQLSPDDPVWQQGDPVPQKPLRVTGRLSSAGSGRFYWHGKLAGDVTIPCRRCLADATVHVRAIDRSDENILGLVFQDRATGERMAAFRAGIKDTSGAIDPMIAAVTKSGAPTDPNAAAADQYTGKTHATPPVVGPVPSSAPPKKK